MKSMVKLITNRLTGKVFNRLTVLNKPAERVGVKTYINVSCECGVTKKVLLQGILSGRIMSCGCLHRESARKQGKANTTHGQSKSSLYGTWKNMIARCTRKTNRSYKWYGGRGIKVCSEWKDLLVFRKWAVSSGYKEHLTIDRIDVNGDYCPSNCRWLSRSDNAKATARKIKRHDGKIFNSYCEMAKFYGIKPKAAYDSIYKQRPIGKMYKHEFINP